MSEDIKISIGKSMLLEIKETRGTSTCYTSKDGFSEVSKETRTYFNWRITGLASKVSVEVVKSKDFDRKEQELYNVSISSDMFDLGCRGFKSREDAIRNAMAFAKRNEIKIDGYEPR